MKSYKFRIYLSKTQEKEMHRHLWISKNLWNKLLEANKKKYEKEKKFISKVKMQKMVKGSGLYSQTAQVLSHRLYDSIKRKIKAKKESKKAGFPRFKSIERMKSLHYPQYETGFWLDKKLKVTPFGEISIKKHREIKGKIKTLTLKRESSGKWFAIFCVEIPEEIPKENKGEALGIDLGLKTFATLSNGLMIQNPRHLKKWEERLAFIQRELSKKKGSSNRKKAKIRVAKLHEKISDCRRDFLHKTTTDLVNIYSFIALEKLASQEMSEENYGKQINDAGWNMFANFLAYKAEGAGCKVVFVDPRNTSKMCNRCGNIKDNLTLWDRTYTCSNCGLSMDRDLNSARNILMRATAGHAGSNASGNATVVASVKEEARTYS